MSTRQVGAVLAKVFGDGDAVHPGHLDVEQADIGVGACRILRSVAEDRHRAVGRCDHSQDHVDGGALAGPVGAQHCDDAAGGNGQADVVDGSER